MPVAHSDRGCLLTTTTTLLLPLLLGLTLHTVLLVNAETFTLGYITGSKRRPGDFEYSRPGLQISGAISLAIDEVGQLFLAFNVAPLSLFFFKTVPSGLFASLKTKTSQRDQHPIFFTKLFFRRFLPQVNSGELGKRGHELDFVVAETYGDEETSIFVTADLWTRNVSAYIGPQETCVHEGRMAAAFNLPMISYVSTAFDDTGSLFDFSNCIKHQSFLNWTIDSISPKSTAISVLFYDRVIKFSFSRCSTCQSFRVQCHMLHVSTIDAKLQITIFISTSVVICGASVLFRFYRNSRFYGYEAQLTAFSQIKSINSKHCRDSFLLEIFLFICKKDAFVGKDSNFNFHEYLQ